MKINKKFYPLVYSIGATLIIGILAFLSLETSTGYWLMISFGPSCVATLILYDSNFARPGNVFFGHLIGILVGIFFSNFFDISFIILGLSVGISILLMTYLKALHPPAVANPLIAIYSEATIDYIIFPVIIGTIALIFLSIIFNRFILKRNYPDKWI